MFIRRLLATITTILLIFFVSTSAFSYSGNYDWDTVPIPAISVPPFFNIYCTDNMIINLSGTNNVPSITMEYLPPNEELVSEVIDGTLFLSVKKKKKNNSQPYPVEPMVINIKNGPIGAITASGNCQVNACRLQSYGMDIETEKNGQIKIEGNIKVNKIIAGGNSEIELLWVNSRQLFVNSFGYANIKMAGTAKETFIKAYGASTIDAQYLRTQRVYVQAKDEGLISVLPLCELRAFAEGHGRIDYYTVPYTAMIITQSSGNVLWMGYRN